MKTMQRIKFRKEWRWGDRLKLARASGISPSYLCDILKDRKRCPPRLAAILERQAGHLGYRIPREQWVFPDLRSRNVLFTDRG